MRDATTIVRERQLVIRREMDRQGISLKAVSLDSGIPYATITSYFPGERDRQPAGIPVAAIYTLAATDALPLDLLSLVLPDGFQITRLPNATADDEDDADYADIIDGALSVVNEGLKNGRLGRLCSKGKAAVLSAVDRLAAARARVRERRA